MTKEKRKPGRPKGSGNKIKKEEKLALPKVPKRFYQPALDFINSLISGNETKIKKVTKKPHRSS